MICIIGFMSKMILQYKMRHILNDIIMISQLPIINSYYLYPWSNEIFGEDGFKPSIPNGVDQSDIPSNHSFCFYSVENPPTNLTENDEMGRHK